MNWYLKNSIEIIKSNNKDPDLLLMANLTIDNELKMIVPYIKECEEKNIQPELSLLNKYNLLWTLKNNNSNQTSLF